MQREFIESSTIYLESVLGICVALMIGSILYLVSKKINSIPYTVLLLIVGISLSPLKLEIFEVIRLTPGSVMFIFLPILLFESAFNFDFREFRRILTPGFLLASIGLLLSAITIAFGLNIFLQIPFLDALMYGCVISSTDPIAVLTIFKQLGVLKKLQLLVDGESFLNDATSVIMFRIISTMVVGSMGAFDSSQIFEGFGSFFFVLLGGVVVGIVLGYLFSEIISKIKNVSLVEITLTIIFAHLVFIISEDFLHVSGIIAVLISGLVIGNYGRTKISPQVTHNMHQMWNLLVFLATSLIFLLIGYEINISLLIENLHIVIIATLLVLVGRALSVYLLVPAYNIFVEEKDRISWAWMHIANWGGLRGVLPLIVILSLPEEYVYREIFIQLVLGAILFTLIINSLTIRPLIKFLGLNKLNIANEIEVKVTEAFVLKRLLAHFKKLKRIHEISSLTYLQSKNRTEYLLGKSIDQIQKWSEKHSTDYNQEMEKVLRRYCLQLEKAYYSKYFSRGIISEKVYNRLRESILLQIENVDESKEQFDSIVDLESVQGKVGSVKLNATNLEKLQAKLGIIKDLETKVLKDYYTFHKLRLLGDEKILEELETFENSGIFTKKILAKIFDFYKDLYHHNRSTLEQLEKLNPSVTNEVEESLLGHESLFILGHVLDEFGEEERISSKAMQNIEIKIL